jgi:hypothetical protein
MYTVSKGWKVKGKDGRVYKPGQEPPLVKSEIKRLLALGAIREINTHQGEAEDDEKEINQSPAGSDAGEEDAAEVTTNADEIPAFGGDISDTQSDPSGGNDEEKPQGGRSKRPK